MEEYQPLSFNTVLGLAAPHSWMASICPVLLGALLSFGLEGKASPLLFCALLAAAVLMHCAVNTLNDYYDYIKGTDTPENSDDPGDAVLVYNRLNPRQVRNVGLAHLAAAMVFGGYAVYRGGMIPLVIGAAGGVVVLCYSAGKRPISYMPVGELASGFVMGGLITLAVFAAFTGYVSARILYMTTPLVIGIGLLMMTNNTCDIERDAATGRVTLPMLLGRERARLVYRLLATAWIVIMPHIILTWFPGGFPVAAVALAVVSPLILRVFRLRLRPDVRGLCLGAILKANMAMHGVYLAGILAHTILE